MASELPELIKLFSFPELNPGDSLCLVCLEHFHRNHPTLYPFQLQLQIIILKLLV